MITAKKLKELVQEFIRLEKDEGIDSTEWAYVALEPDLIASQEVTLEYLQSISKEEFITLGENGWFEHILSHFKSTEIYEVIDLQYVNFFGTDKKTCFYEEYIADLKCYVK